MITPTAERQRRLAALGSAAAAPALLRSRNCCAGPSCDLAAVWSLTGIVGNRRRPDCAAQVEVAVKYAGYVDRQHDAIRRAARMEDARIPERLDYEAIPGLSREVRERLSRRAAAVARPGVAHRRGDAGRGVAACRSTCAASASA